MHAEPETFQDTEGNLYEGYYLHHGNARAFVSVKPWVRVLCYWPDPKTPSPLSTKSYPQASGLRTQFFEDGRQMAYAGNVAAKPGTLVEHSSASVEIRIEWSDESGCETATTLKVSFASDGSLIVLHGVTNLADRKRVLAPWSVSCFPQKGAVYIPFESPQLRTITFYSSRFPAFLNGAITERAFALELDRFNPEKFYKIGVRSRRGWYAFLLDGAAWVSFSPFSSLGIYPDGGANLACFLSPVTINRPLWVELEQVGGSQMLGKGETVWLQERMFYVRKLDMGEIPLLESIDQRLDNILHGISSPRP